jgi:hypothetical protein
MVYYNNKYIFKINGQIIDELAPPKGRRLFAKSTKYCIK